jgi:transporter family-2 protein
MLPLAAILIGISFAAQPAINGAAVKTLGSPAAAAALSVGITFFCLILVMPIFGGSLAPGLIAKLPWWVVFGGMIGAFVVAGGAAIAPVTGVAVFFVCLVSGQLIGSALVDHFGAFGMTVRPISLIKACGLALVLAGVLLVRAG